MTLGVGVPDRDYREPLHALEGRALSHGLSGSFGGDVGFEVVRTIDPSDGANYSGGSSYSDGLPLLPSSAGLAGVLGATPDAKKRGLKKLETRIRDVRAGSMSYEEAMNWVPSPMTAELSALAAGPFKEPAADLRPGFGEIKLNIGWLALLGGAAAWWWYNR